MWGVRLRRGSAARAPRDLKQHERYNAMKATPNGRNEEMRFECENWDTEAKGFHVDVTSSGRGKKPARKVLTKGIKTVNLWPYTCKEIQDLLRKGYELRLMLGGSKENAVRLFPMMSADLKRIEVHAATLKWFREETLSGKKAVFRRRGTEVSRATVEYFTAEKLSQRAGGEADEEAVTPDPLVKCPKCGYRFRVGRRNVDLNG